MTSLQTSQSQKKDKQDRDKQDWKVAKQRSQFSQTIVDKEVAAGSKQPQLPSVKGKERDNSTKQTSTEREDGRVGMHETEERVLTFLLNDDPTNHDSARDLFAELLTQCKGEYVLRIGRQPPHAALYAGELTDASDGWMGTSRTADELDRLKEKISIAAGEIGAQTSILFEHRTGHHPRASLLLRFPSLNVSTTPEVRCAVVGNVDSGKSTTLGVLTRGSLDDGRGRARVALFRHKHEFESGRTSSIGMEILGFEPSGAPILPRKTKGSNAEVNRREKLSWDEISNKSAKIISFIDLAGHEKYLKTTIYGLTSSAPSCIILIVGANAGLIGMSKEHLAIALALSVPVVLCITKVDMTPEKVMENTIAQAVKVLKSPGCRKTPVFVNSTETAVELATTFGSDRTCPIFRISNVTGEGIECMRTYLNLLPSSDLNSTKFSVNQPLEFSITEVYSVPYHGTVVDGIVNAGSINVGDAVLYGPDGNGNFASTSIKTMQRKRADVTTASAGQSVACALKRVRHTDIRKGMVLVSKTDNPPHPVYRFEGQVLVLYHNTTMQKNYQAMLHCGAVRQTVKIIGMDHPYGLLRTGDKANVQFEFITHPEFVKEGMKLLFREGRTKGLGVITRILP